MRLLVAAALVSAFVGLAAQGAQAELTERGDLFVRFQGEINPTAPPRTQRAPITVTVAGRVKTLSGERPRALRKIEISLNRGGELNSYGLPVALPDAVNHYGYVQGIAQRLHRNYTYRGQRRTYLR